MEVIQTKETPVVVAGSGRPANRTHARLLNAGSGRSNLYICYKISEECSFSSALCNPTLHKMTSFTIQLQTL
jgi:hypothetical protein